MYYLMEKNEKVLEFEVSYIDALTDETVYSVSKVNNEELLETFMEVRCLSDGAKDISQWLNKVGNEDKGFTTHEISDNDYFWIKSDTEKLHYSEKYYLNVPFLQKDIVKELGAKFDFTTKQWYYTNPDDEHLFSRWLFKKTLSYEDLSKEQQELIDRTKDGENVLVDACIGSGKTTAIQVLCNQFPNKKILYLTYNALLKLDAREKIILKNVSVHNYHSYAYSVLKKMNVSAGASDLIQVFNNYRPKIPRNYDLLVIDEYQDIECEIATLLEYIKEENPNIQIIAVGDMKQKIYDKTTLDVQSFISSFLGEHTVMSFTKCFRLSKQYAAKLGKIWNKKIVGVNPSCKVTTMNLSEAEEFLSEQDLPNILCLGARSGDMATVLNRLERHYPDKYNKKTVYASITDEDRKNIAPRQETAIFTTFDSCKGLERKICLVFDYTDDYWGIRSHQNGVKYEILRNIFLVAASRGKEQIIFVAKEDEERLLSEEMLMDNFDVDSKQEYKKPFSMSDMYSFKYKEDVEECYSLLNIKPLHTEEQLSDIKIKTNDELIDLSPCIGIYQEASYFKNYDIKRQIDFAATAKYENENSFPKYVKDVLDRKRCSLEKEILCLTSIETNYTRYYFQIKPPFISPEQKKELHKRLKTVFTRNETVQVDCGFILMDKDGREYEFSGRADVIKDNVIYELKFVSELNHEHFLQLASYLVAMNIDKGILWNVRDNQMYEVTVPNRINFLRATLKTVTKGAAKDFKMILA